MVLMLSSVLSTQVLADTFTVNSTDDPETGDAANCTGLAPDCSLRDALAAAEAYPDLDTIVFAVNDTIHLRKQLVANHPVGIEGGSGTTLRVHQDYEILMQLDRFDDNGDGVREVIQVLHPSFYVEIPPAGAPILPMLELHGSGSFVNNMIIDGSITPQAEDLGVKRIDRNSDGRTDNRLFTVEDSDGDYRWLVASGIRATFDPSAGGGQVEFNGNTLRYFTGVALHIENSALAVVSNNVASVGVFEGISFRNGGILTVTKNTVSGFRNGLSMELVSGVTVIDNHLFENRSSGLSIEGASAQYGENVIKKNTTTNNDAAGMTINFVDTATVVSNEIRSNGLLGIDLKASRAVSVMSNKVMENGLHPLFHGGIRVAEGAGLNSVVGNTVTANSGFGIVIDDALGNVVEKNIVTEQGGAGIVLLNEAQGNFVENNKFEKNDVGIVSTTLYGLFPSGNTIRENGLKDNFSVDIADEDPVCNDTWVDNKFKTSFAASGSCIQ